MTVYFLSKIKAAIKLNGEFLGCVDAFERRVELDFEDGVFVELIPEGEYIPTSFFIDEKIVSSPPPFLDVYLLEGDILLFAREYASSNANFALINQVNFYGNLVTVFKQGKVKLSFEGKEYFLLDLPDCFKECEFEKASLCGFDVLLIKSKEHLAIVSDKGKLIFLNKVISYELEDFLKVCVDFETSAKALCECKFFFDGTTLTLTESKTTEQIEPSEDILHFAFFESVLTCGDFLRFLCADLQPKAPYIKEYLGDFCDVIVPPEKFFAKHENVKAVGLVYPKNKNLFEVKYFAVDVINGKINNVFPVE